MKARMRIALASVACTATACAGPNAVFNVGNQTAPVNLILGAHQAVVQAPVGPITMPLPPSLAPFVPVTQATPPSRPSIPPPPVIHLGPCPNFHPLDPVVGGTSSLVTGPPTPATYTYRATMTDTVGSQKATFTGNTTWKVTVAPPDPTTGGYDVTVQVSVGSVKSTRVFLMLPTAVTAKTSGHDTPADAPQTLGLDETIDQYNSTVEPYGLPQIPRNAPDVARYGPAGIYLVSQTTGSSTFTPTVPIPLVQTPLSADPFTSIGTDGVTSMTFVSTVQKRESVNACGRKLDGLQVALTGGHIASLTPDGKMQEVDFTETFDFGLQFGGLPIRDRGTVTGVTAPGSATIPDSISRQFDYTVNSVPKPPKA